MMHVMRTHRPYVAVIAVAVLMGSLAIGFRPVSPSESDAPTLGSAKAAPADQIADASTEITRTDQSTPAHARDHEADGYWPQWRGPRATGVAPEADPPVEWGEDRNIRWKTALPGLGHSSPIVWADRVFLTTAVPVGRARPPRYSRAPGAHDNSPVTHEQQLEVIAVDRNDGRVLWRREVNRVLPHEGVHHTASYASASPLTDGERVYASFGSYGLYALDFEGRVIWGADLGDMQAKHGHGEGASPVLIGDKLIVNWDHEGQSFLAALDKRTGQVIWKVDRDEPTSWATPIIAEAPHGPQVVVSGTNRVRGYDPSDGREIWRVGGLSNNIVASPVYADGMVFAGSSYETQAMLAIRLEGASGELTDTSHVVWRRGRGTPYVPSPLLYEGVLYYHMHYQNVLWRVDAASGRDRPGGMRLQGIRDVYASPIAAARRVYITDLDGATLVISHDDRPSALALNRLDDSFAASPAIAGDSLFLRGARFLYRIAADTIDGKTSPAAR